MKKIKQLKISKREVIIFLVIIELLLVFLLIQSYNKNLDKYKYGIKDIMNNKLFAVMVEDDYGDYQPTTSFPTTPYIFNSELSNCIDREGNVVENAISYADGVIGLLNIKISPF